MGEPEPEAAHELEIARLRAEVDRLQRLLAQAGVPSETAPDDTKPTYAELAARVAHFEQQQSLERERLLALINCLPGHVLSIDGDGRVVVRDEAGRPLFRDGNIRDITERELSEQEREQLLSEVRRSEEELDTVFKALPYLVSIHDKDGRYLRANPAVVELFGFNPVQATREPIARHLNARFPNGEPLTPANMPSSRALEGEACFNVEYLVTDSHGRDHLLLMNAIPIWSNGEVSGAVFAQMDITEQREAEERLRRANELLRESDRQKNRFLAVLSHELRNPLTPITNSLHILNRVMAGSEQANRAKAVIERQVAHLTRLVDDLLDVTRIASGKLRLQRARFDLAQMLRRTVDDHRAMFANAGLTLDIEGCRESVWMDGDETRMAQAVGNLLSNAVKFTEHGGRIVLAFTGESTTATGIIHIRDTGAGIDPKLLPRLFEPFVQADTTLDRSKSGLGLGLALVKSVAELHGGAVEVHSDGPGKGTEFVLRVPVEIEAGLPLGTTKRSQDRAQPRRVLIIEDNIDAVNSLRDVLESGSHQVDVAYDGPEGIKKARTFEPDIVFCDIGLPGMSGYEVAKALRASETLRSTYLVALTGYAQPEDLQRAREAGFDSHIAKPPSLETIEKVLGR